MYIVLLDQVWTEHGKWISQCIFGFEKKELLGAVGLLLLLPLVAPLLARCCWRGAVGDDCQCIAYLTHCSSQSSAGWRVAIRSPIEDGSGGGVRLE